MPENKRSEGMLVTLEGAWAASNIVAGTPVQGASATNAIYTLGDNTTGAGTGHNAERFLGILDEDVSASQTPITVWTKGVVRMILNADMSATDIHNGNPVFANSGLIVNSRKALKTGYAAIGTIVGRISATVSSGGYINVKINPGSYRWMYSIPADLTASCMPSLSWQEDADTGAVAGEDF